MATSNTLKETQSAFDTERTQKDQEIQQLKDEVYMCMSIVKVLVLY